METRRRPWIAALLSFCLAGLGHLYAGQPRAAAFAYLISMLAGATMLAAALFLPLAPLNVLPVLMVLVLAYVWIPVHAYVTARSTPTAYRLRPFNRWYIYLGIIALFALIVQPGLYSLVKTRVVEAYRVPSGSMEPTILMGDFLYVAKWPSVVRAAGHDGLIVHESIEEPGLMSIKRLVGLPGDTLQMKRGMLYRNGQQLHEPYAVHHEPGRSEDKIHRSRMRDWQAQYLAGVSLGDYNPDLQDWGPLVVPTDSFFGLGDNRDASYDGRYYGFAPLSYIRGRPWVVYFSRARERGSAFGRIRWDRLGRVLH